jgi:hypothetical protein
MPRSSVAEILLNSAWTLAVVSAIPARTGSPVKLVVRWFMIPSVHLRWIAFVFTAGIISNDPMTTVAEPWFGDREMSKVGTEFVDSGFDFLELGRGWGSGIVYKGRGFRGLLNI